MLKKTILFFFVSCLLQQAHASVQLPDRDEVIQLVRALDRELIIECITLWKEQVQEVKQQYESLTLPDHYELRKYSPEEERYTTLPQLLTPIQADQYLYLKVQESQLGQNSWSGRSSLGIFNSYLPETASERGFFTQSYTVNKIHFSDGTTEDTPLHLTAPYFYTWIPTAKLIDRADITAHYGWVTELETYEVKDQLRIEGGSIEVRNRQDNRVEVVLRGKATEALRIVAFNSEGKPLDVQEENYYSPGRQSVYLRAFEELERQAPLTGSTEELQQLVCETVRELPPAEAEKELLHYYAFCTGDVHDVRVYLARDRVTGEREMTVVNRDVEQASKGEGYSPDLREVLHKKTLLYGIIDKSGQTVVPFEFTYIYKYNDCYFEMRKKPLEETETEEIEPFLNPQDIYYVDAEKKEYFRLPDAVRCLLSTKREIILMHTPEGKYTVWNGEGRQVDGVAFDSLATVLSQDNLFDVMTDGKHRIMDASGEYLTPPLDGVLGAGNNFYFTWTKDPDNEPASLWFLDREKKELVYVPRVQEYNRITDSCMFVRRQEGGAVWNHEGRNVTEYLYDWVKPLEHTDLFVTWIGEKNGLLHPSGKEVMPARALSMTTFSKEGFCVVEDEESGFMLINNRGEQVLLLSEYEDVGSPMQGLMSVQKEGVWGYMDTSGKIVLPLIYEEAYGFSEFGHAVVKYKGLYGIINKEGEYLISPTARTTDRIIRMYQGED